MADIDPELRAVLEDVPIAHLATLMPDGAPHSVPVWVDVHEGRIAVSTGPHSLKARNTQRDARVAISLVRPDDRFSSIVLRGREVGRVEGDAAWPIVDRIARKYIGVDYPRDQARVILLIEPERVVTR